MNATRCRTTLPMNGTYSRPTVLLDFSSDLACRYAQAWLHRAGRLKVPASGVMRRALAVYVAHLQHTDTDPAAEFHAVRRACGAGPGDAKGQEAAQGRLLGASADAALPSFHAVYFGAESLARQAALEARHEALVQQVKGEQAQRMNTARHHKAQQGGEQ